MNPLPVINADNTKIHQLFQNIIANAVVHIDEKKVETMRDGHIPIYEPGLEVLFLRNIVKKRLSFMVYRPAHFET